ncbi:rhodopsin-like [Aphidius gifuensis]|nr:rhodopsin-like [Aphidius gifuensis]
MSGFIKPGLSAGMAYGNGGNQSVIDRVLPDMLEMTPKYWHQFPALNPIWQQVLGSLVMVLCCISLTGNSMVMYIFATTKSLRTPSNLFIINLAFFDFCMMFFMAAPMAINSYYGTWIFGPMACDIYGAIGSLCGCGSIYTMTMIAFDRYNVIVKGLSAKPLTIAGALHRIFWIWALSLAWTITPFFGWGKYSPEGNLTACGTDYLAKDFSSRSYVFIYSVGSWAVPLVLICYSYYYILSAVSAHEKNMREQAKKMNVASLRSSDNQNTNAEAKLAKVALMTISLWFMAWTPYLVINVVGVFELPILTPLFTIWGLIFAKANSVYNPIVYAISHPKYRAALNERFPKLFSEKTKATLTSDATSATTAVSSEERA